MQDIIGMGIARHLGKIETFQQNGRFRASSNFCPIKFMLALETHLTKECRNTIV